MIGKLHRTCGPAMALLVGAGLALPAAAGPVLHLGQQRPGSSPTVTVACSVADKNACYLRMNTCLYQNSRRPNSDRAGEYRACEAAYYDCIARFKCQRGPVW